LAGIVSGPARFQQSARLQWALVFAARGRNQFPVDFLGARGYKCLAG
jgi:hypothetical protein